MTKLNWYVSTQKYGTFLMCDNYCVMKLDNKDPKKLHEKISDTRPETKEVEISENRLRKIIRFQIEGRGGKVNPKDDFKGFIEDIKSCIRKHCQVKEQKCQ